MAEPGYYRFPTVHDATIVFACEDDLWTVPTAGGVARRLTSGLGQSAHPALSPDGAWLAFTGRDEGQAEVYLMPSEGGQARRLTFLGADTRVIGWGPDGRSILFSSNVGEPFARNLRLYRLDRDGGEPERLPTGPAMSISYASGAPETAGDVWARGAVIGRNATDIARWKRYRGGLTGDMWVDPRGDGDWRRLIQLNGNVALPLWVGERIYFVSDHEGIGNLYSCAVDGTGLTRHTHHTDFYVRHPATDGRQIVYHAGGDLYRFDTATGQAAIVEIRFFSPRSQRNRRFAPASQYLQSYAVHPKGRELALTVRGKPFTLANFEGAVTQHGAPLGVRYRLATWLADGKRLVVTSDASGEEALEVHVADGSAEAVRLDEIAGIEQGIGRPIQLVTAPRGDLVALTNHRNELILVDLAARTGRVLDTSRHARIRGVAWSPDARWLAYGIYDTRQTSQIRLCRVETGEVHPATRPVLQDLAPAFDPDGKYLYFLSLRDFNPVYDSLHFDLGFPRGMRPCLLTLRADLPSPFEPVPPDDDERKGEEDKKPADDAPADEGPKPADDAGGADDPDGAGGDAAVGDGAAGDGTADAGGAAAVQGGDVPVEALEAGAPQAPNGATTSADSDPEKPKDDGPPPLRIDLEGIADRVIAFPVPEGSYGQIRGLKGKAVYSVLPLEGALGTRNGPQANGRIEAYDFKEYHADTLIDRVTSFDVSQDAKTLVYRSGSRLRVVRAGEKPPQANDASGRKSGWVDLGRLKISVEPQAEWEQMYREAWRLQRDQFWSADMSGVDWQMIYHRYHPLIARVATRGEFSDLMWEMQGELGTSHAYEFGGDYRSDPTYSQASLGADLRHDAAADAYFVSAIARGDTWDDQASSPLARPGADVRVGDRLVAIGGRTVGQGVSPAQLLVNQGGQEVRLTFERDGGRRTITVKTLYNDRAARYRDWVEANRAKVHAATQGRVGYLHIPDMGPAGFAEFHRGFLAEVDRLGLIIDVRFNGGGHVSQLLLEKLARRRIGYDIQRWGDPVPYPYEAVMGPMVALTNEQAGSDGDMFSHAFKLMQLGPLLGKRTWGGVIGINPRDTLVDGGLTTQPEFSFWFEDVGWGLENYGTDPDFEVEYRPQDDVAGRDPQLDAALAAIEAQLADNAPHLPEFGARPSLKLPEVPA